MQFTDLRFDNNPNIRHASPIIQVDGKTCRIVLQKVCSRISEYKEEICGYTTSIENMELVGNTWKHVSFGRTRHFETERDAWCDYLSRCRRG